MNQNFKSSKPEEVCFSVPFHYYISGQQISCNHNGLTIPFNVNGDMPDGHKIPIDFNGKPCDESAAFLFLVVSMDSQNSGYKRDSNNPCDLVQILNFTKKFEGKETQFEFTLPDNSKQQITLTLTEGYQLVLENQGLLKADGTKGKLTIVVHLE